jgi:hypothetical protein
MRSLAAAATIRQRFQKTDAVQRCYEDAFEPLANIDRWHITGGSCPVGFRAGSRLERPQADQDTNPIRVSEPAIRESIAGIGASSVTDFFTPNVIRTILGR